MPIWKRIEDYNAGFAYSMSDAMSLLEWRHPGSLQPISQGRMVISSDYSGQHRRATHEAYSFLLTTEPELNKRTINRKQFRDEWLSDGRRISFKNLSDGMKLRALIPFLEVAFELQGNLITILVDKRIKSFMDCKTDELTETFPDCFPIKTPSGTIEKMLRLATILSMLLERIPRWSSALCVV